MHSPVVHCDNLFDEHTMSVHILQGQPIVRKIWKPWERTLEKTDIVRDRSTILSVIQDRETHIAQDDNAYKEIERKASQIWQLGQYRVVIIAPPIAPKREITIVKPLVHLWLEDYELPETLVTRLQSPKRWVLIAWSPGEWKTTFAQALLEKLATQNLIIKTIEAPRDVQADGFITQYGLAHTTHDEIRDILLLTRPDITLFDEVRNRNDFDLYKDLRLAWVWLIGVMHATAPIDAIQRCIGIIEMWMISHVIDTVLFIEAGQVKQALTLRSTVKTPIGMQSEDLARPVIVVTSLLDDKDLYEIYSYSDNVVVMPLDGATEKQKPSPVYEAAAKAIKLKVQAMINTKCDVEVNSATQITLTVADRDAGRIIGKWWDNIQKLQHALGLSIKLKTFEERKAANPSSSWWTWVDHQFNIFTKDRKIVWEIDLWSEHELVKILVRIWNRTYPFQTDKNGIITIRKRKLINEMDAWRYELEIVE